MRFEPAIAETDPIRTLPGMQGQTEGAVYAHHRASKREDAP